MNEQEILTGHNDNWNKDQEHWQKPPTLSSFAMRSKEVLKEGYTSIVKFADKLQATRKVREILIVLILLR